MNNILNIEVTKKSVIDELNNTYSKIDLNNVSSVSELIEENIKLFVTESIKTNSQSIFGFALNDDNLICNSSGLPFRVENSIDLKSYNRIHYRLNPLVEERIRFSSLIISIKGYGRFKEIVFSYPTKLKKSINFIFLHELIKAIYDTSYKWFYNKVINLVNKDLDNLSTNLYGHLKKYIYHDEIRENLWFASVTKGFGFRLLDSDLADSSFKIIEENAYSLNHSTNKYVAELLKTYLPEDILLMRQALKSKKCIDVSLEDAKYKKEGSIYALTLGSLYGCDSFTVYPVYVSSKLNVLALFDTKNKKYIKPILDLHKTELQEISKKEVNKIHSLLSYLHEVYVKPFWDSLEVKPGAFGVNFDIKEFLKKISGNSNT